MVMDLWDTDIYQVLNHKLNQRFAEGFPPPLVRSLLKQLLQGTAYLHSQWVMHRDIKSANLLTLHDASRAVLCDLGMARKFSFPLGLYTPDVVTLHYRAPEVLLPEGDLSKGCTYGPAIDVWSLGCVFAELCSGRILFPGKTELEQLDLMWGMLGTPTPEASPRARSWPAFGSFMAIYNLQFTQQPDNKLAFEGLSPAGLDLMIQMLTLNPDLRISAKDALQHEYFA